MVIGTLVYYNHTFSYRPQELFIHIPLAIFPQSKTILYNQNRKGRCIYIYLKYIMEINFNFWYYLHLFSAEIIGDFLKHRVGHLSDGFMTSPYLR